MSRNWLNIVALAVMAVLVLSGCAGGGAAGGYPKQPLEIIAPSGAGGGWDTLARTVQASLETEKLYTQPTSVVNKTGGGGGVGMAYIVEKSGNDYELIVYSPPLIINTINKTFTSGYKELTPLAKLITDYQVFLVKADSPYTTLKQLMDDIVKDEAAIKVAGGSSPGSMDHLAFLKVAKAAGADPVAIPYIAFNGGAEAITTLLGGNVAVVSTGIGESLAQLEAGTVRALAVTSAERRSGVLKDVPTVKEAGYDVTYEVWRGIFGPPKMSDAAKKWWGDTLKKMVETTTWKDRLAKLQWEPAYADADAFAKFLDEEHASYLTLMTDLGLAK